MRLENNSLTTENPLVFSGEKAKEHQASKASKKRHKRTKTKPTRVRLHSNGQMTLMNVLEQVKTRSFYVKHRSKNPMQKG